MAFLNRQLFLDRFIAFNVERYQGDPETVQKLQALQLSNIVFQNPRKETTDSGVVRHLVDLASEGFFTAQNQKFTPADYTLHNVAELVTKDTKEMADLQKELTAGIYWLATDDQGTKVGALLVAKGEKTDANILGLVQGKCYYELSENEITISEDLTQVTIDSETVVGVLVVVESLGDINNAVYDGSFYFDGTLTY